MDYNELYEYRIKLNDSKKHSSKQVLNILQILETSIIAQEAINKSKITKTLKTLQTMAQPTNFSKEEFVLLKQKVNIVLDKFSAQQANLNSQQQLNDTKDLPKPQLVKQTSTLPDIDVFQNYKDNYPCYVDRKVYLTGLSKQFIANLMAFKEIEVLPQEDLNKVRDVIEIIEKQIYHRRQQQSGSRKLYEQDMRILGQYLKRDKNGSVTNRIFSRQFDPIQASQLRSTDWIDDKSKQEAQRLLQEKLEAESTGFYKQLAKREMEGVDGKRCNGCGERKVYLVEEKQTRASDEPTTKFFECFNCGDKFKIC
ncbi:hypothetical protein pb186bvf_017651 [Paramecium bursaria]